jgi:hypothetical protein
MAQLLLVTVAFGAHPRRLFTGESCLFHRKEERFPLWATRPNLVSGDVDGPLQLPYELVLLDQTRMPESLMDSVVLWCQDHESRR